MKILVENDKSDADWASWVTWILREEGYEVTSLDEELVPGVSEPALRDRALRATSCVLTLISSPNWDPGSRPILGSAVAIADQRMGTEAIPYLIPLRYRAVRMPPVLNGRRPIDLTGLAEEQASLTLRAAMSRIAQAHTRTTSLPTPEVRPPFPRTNGRGRSNPRRSLLPVPSGETPDVLPELVAATIGNGQLTVHLVSGPGDAGKSTILRELMRSARQSGLEAAMKEANEEFGPMDPVPDVLLVDHLERLSPASPLSRAHHLLAEDVPSMVHRGVTTIVLAVDADWAESFERAWHTSIQTILRSGLPDADMAVWPLRAYTESELGAVCSAEGLDEVDFDRIELRLPGILALARAHGLNNEPVSTHALRAQAAQRWISRESAIETDARRCLWKSAGEAWMASGEWSLSASTVTTGVPDAYSSSSVPTSPFVRRGGRLVFQSPAWADVAVAEALLDAIEARDLPNCAVPISSRALDAARSLRSGTTLQGLLDDLFSDAAKPSFGAHGYLAPALGTLWALVSPSLNVSQCDLSGPPNRELDTPPESTVNTVQIALVELLRANVLALAQELATVHPEAPSAWRGGNRHWTVARGWARTLRVLDTIRDALGDEALTLSKWRYEAILDVAVTDATTAFLRDASDVGDALSGRRSPVSQLLADVWDGVNDGLWDQLVGAELSVASAFTVPDGWGKLEAHRCSLQRARLGANDAAEWRFAGCDLLLCDLRSCANLSRRSFAENTNWWAAMLEPAVRYDLSRDCADPDFANWCKDPPWVNPYWDGGWPRPFDGLLEDRTEVARG